MRAEREEVVVTGMGAVTPFGVGVDHLWEGVREGRSAVKWLRILPNLDPEVYPVRYAGELCAFSVDEHLRRHCEVREERSVQMGLVAAREALHQAQLLDDEDRLLPSGNRIETIIGSGHGACFESEVGYGTFFQKGARALRPTTVPKAMFNSLSSNLSIYFGMTGGNLVIASACASAASAIGLGTLMIRHGYADVVLAGGADSCLTPAMFACWTKLRVMAQHDVPQKASRPFDAHRNGMVLGEGGAMLVLESRKSAERRAVEPLGKICGVGTSSDAHHITSPTLLGQRTAIGRCLADAGISPAEVDYLNAHGTGTRANDETEGQAIVEVFGPRGPGLPVSSTKSMIGHSLGASGAIELVVCMHAARNEFVPPTLNCDEPEPAVGVDFVPNTGRPHRVKFAMSNSFAFGGNNVSLLTQRLL